MPAVIRTEAASTGPKTIPLIPAHLDHAALVFGTALTVEMPTVVIM
jgi:hypothetical protein